MLTIRDILLQMNDGIHHAKDFMRVDTDVHFLSPLDNGINRDTKLMPIPRDKFIDLIDPVAGDRWDVMESLYGKYNSFAYEPGTNNYYAWYDNGR
jgi:hypothetical protein